MHLVAHAHMHERRVRSTTHHRKNAFRYLGARRSARVCGSTRARVYVCKCGCALNYVCVRALVCVWVRACVRARGGVQELKQEMDGARQLRSAREAAVRELEALKVRASFFLRLFVSLCSAIYIYIYMHVCMCACMCVCMCFSHLLIYQGLSDRSYGCAHDEVSLYARTHQRM